VKQHVYLLTTVSVVSILASSAAELLFEPRQVNPKTVKLVYFVSPLSTLH